MWAKRLGLALAFGGSITIGMKVLQNVGNDQTAAPETAQIVVATTHVPRGEEVTEDMLETREVPKDSVPPGAVADPEEAVGRLVTINGGLQPGTVLEAALASAEQRQGLPSLIPPGMRAFTIQTSSATSGVAGLVAPEDRVDVMLTVESRSREDTTGGGRTMTLLQNVEVLAVNQDYVREEAEDGERSSSRKSKVESVTMIVSPEQAARLNLAQNRGSLHLALRNPDATDDTSGPINISFNDIIGVGQPEEMKIEKRDDPAINDFLVASVDPPPVPRTGINGAQALATDIVEPATEPEPQLPPIVTYRGAKRTEVILSRPNARPAAVPAPVAAGNGAPAVPIGQPLARSGFVPAGVTLPGAGYSQGPTPRPRNTAGDPEFAN